jgi:hypothetical protein
MKMMRKKRTWKNISYGSLTAFSKEMGDFTRIVGIEQKPFQKNRYVVGIVDVVGFLNPVMINKKIILLRTNNLNEAQSKVKNYIRSK